MTLNTRKMWRKSRQYLSQTEILIKNFKKTFKTLKNAISEKFRESRAERKKSVDFSLGQWQLFILKNRNLEEKQSRACGT